MKKMLSLVLLLTLIFSLTACRNADTSAPADEPSPQPTTPATILLADFKDQVKKGAVDPEAIANQLVTNPVIDFAPVVMPVDPGYLNGFSADVTGFDSGAVFAPMIGSIPFIGYVFSVSGSADAFVQQLKTNADLRWNICTQADEMVCEAVGNTVFFVMAPSSFEN